MAHQNECHFAHEITKANALPKEIPDETVALPLLIVGVLSELSLSMLYARGWEDASCARKEE
jgi:hypothetical protein